MRSGKAPRTTAPPERRGRFRALLLTLLLLAVVFPFAERLLPELRLDLVFRLAVLVAGIRAFVREPRAAVALALLGIVSLGSSLLGADAGDAWALVAVGTALALYATMLGLLVVDVFQRPGVTRDSLFGAACTYLLIVLVFGSAFRWLELLVPGSFHLPETMSAGHIERSFTYFSAVTLTTLGYGDVVPLSEGARSLVVIEAVLGVLYPAVLIARVVALYASGDASAPFERRFRLARVWEDSSRFEALFILQGLQIVAYPYVSRGWNQLIGAAIVLTALSTLPTSRRRLVVAILLGVPALVHWSAWDEGSAWAIVGAAFLTAFLFAATFAILEHMSRQRVVDREVIFGACCAYVMLGAAFAAAYQLVFALAPGEFSLPPDMPAAELFATMTYLSYVTLTTLGYGDILPLDGAAHMLASLEAILGVLFSAMLVARLVSLYRLRPEPGSAD